MTGDDELQLHCDYCGFTGDDDVEMGSHMLTHVSCSKPKKSPFTGMKTMAGEFNAESMHAGWRAMHLTASVLWRRNIDIMEYGISRMEVSPGSKILLLGEDNVTCGFTNRLQDAVSPGGELIDIDFRPEVSKDRFSWPLCTEHCADFPDGSFDAAMYVSWHHMEDMYREVKALARVVRPGGKVVLVDHGPGHRFFRMAEEEVHVGMLAWIFVSRQGVGHHGIQDLDDAYEAGKSLHTRWSSVEAIKAMKGAGLKNVRHSMMKSVDIVWGEK